MLWCWLLHVRNCDVGEWAGSLGWVWSQLVKAFYPLTEVFVLYDAKRCWIVVEVVYSKLLVLCGSLQL